MEGLILTFIFMGMVIAIMTSYTKGGILLSALSTFLFFQVVDFTNWIPVILFIVGLLLIVAEVFIPEFGLVGILGIGSIIGGLYMTIGDLSQTIADLSIAIVFTACLVTFLLKKGYSVTNINRLVLANTDVQAKKANQPEEQKIAVGIEGVAETTLRPSGKAVFKSDDQTYYDVLSTQGHISKGTPIVIEKISGTKISVRRVTN